MRKRACADLSQLPGKHYIDWELPDPSARPISEVRDIRDEIARRVTALAGAMATEP
jgi:arsenate reductase